MLDLPVLEGECEHDPTDELQDLQGNLTGTFLEEEGNHGLPVFAGRANGVTHSCYFYHPYCPIYSLFIH